MFSNGKCFSFSKWKTQLENWEKKKQLNRQKARGRWQENELFTCLFFIWKTKWSYFPTLLTKLDQFSVWKIFQLENELHFSIFVFIFQEKWKMKIFPWLNRKISSCIRFSRQSEYFIVPSWDKTQFSPPRLKEHQGYVTPKTSTGKKVVQ